MPLYFHGYVMGRIYIIVALFAVFVLFALVSNGDYNDEQEYQKYACEMVKLGAWPEQFCK